MTTHKPRTIPELLAGQDNSSLTDIIRHGRQLKGLSLLLSELLGPELAAHCQLANIRGSTLVLTADSAAWATRVRYQSPQLLKQIRSEKRLGDIETIHVRITTPTASSATSHPLRRVSLSETASECLNQCAAVIDDPHLSSALSQLAKRKRSDN